MSQEILFGPNFSNFYIALIKKVLGDGSSNIPTIVDKREIFQNMSLKSSEGVMGTEFS